MYGPSEDIDAGVRRTVYASISRGRSNDVMKLYDVPAPLAHIPMRQPTLNPLQALFVMNSGFVQEQAEALAEQVAARSDGGSEDSDAVSKGVLAKRERRRSGARRAVSQSPPTSRATRRRCSPPTR